MRADAFCDESPGSSVIKLRKLPNEQKRADHQHQRDRNLDDDQKALQRESLAALSQAAAAGFDRHAGLGL